MCDGIWSAGVVCGTIRWCLVRWWAVAKATLRGSKRGLAQPSAEKEIEEAFDQTERSNANHSDGDDGNRHLKQRETCEPAAGLCEDMWDRARKSSSG